MAKVKAPTPAYFSNYQSGQALAKLAGSVLVVLMMVSIGIGVYYLGTRLAPGWHGLYIIWITLLLSIESMITRIRVRDLETRERVIFRVSEWIAFAVAIKAIIYLINDPSQLITDISRWQKDFFMSFFSGEYMLALFVALLVWWASASFAGQIEDLYDREMDTDWDDLGKMQNALRDMRNRISAKIFFLGTLVVVMAVASRLDLSMQPVPSLGIPINSFLPVANVLFFFALSLVLLTQTQFALLRTRWLTQRLTVSPDLARNWIRYGLVFFILISILVFFLPTNYSLGLLDTLKVALGIIFQGMMFLIVLLTLPFTYCLSLFKLSSAPTSSAPGGSFAPPPVVTGGGPSDFWEFVKSFLFWAFFIGILFFAMRHFIMQNTALMKAIRKVPFLSWAAGVWKTILAWVKGANHQISALINTGIQRLRSQQISLPSSPFRRSVNISKMSPREKVIYYYLNLLKVGGDKGFERKPSQTPYQYRQVVASSIPETNPDIETLTENFIEARYSQHSIDETNASLTASIWERIRDMIRNWNKKES